MMEALMDNRAITLLVNGRKMDFSEKELIAILEESFTTKANMVKVKLTEEAKPPIEGKCFAVNPSLIDQSIFKQKRNDIEQEKMRRTIVKAFTEMKDNPWKYSKPFKTLIPKKTWSEMAVWELIEFSKNVGDHITDWVEQALEWAQRITNGETWENVCNTPDTAKWYRLVIWKNGHARIIGGSTENHNDCPACDVGCDDCNIGDVLANTVPSIVVYE